MKKFLLVLSLVSVMVLTGCSNDTPDNKPDNDNKVNTNVEVKEEVNSFDASSYEGTWKSEKEGEEMNYVTIKVIDDGMIGFENVVVSEPPENMNAKIEVTDVILNSKGEGEFEFEEDGWSHKGNGIIKLTNNGVEIEILKTEFNSNGEEDNRWQINSGKYDSKLVE